MLEKLSKSQESLMGKVAQEWISRVSSGKKINKKIATKLIQKLYEFCKLKKPEILFVSSPLGCQFAVNLIKKGDNVWDNVRANVGANVRDNVWDNVRANVGANVWDNVWDNVGNNVWANVRDNVWDNVRANVGANVRDNVRDNVWDNVRANVWDNVGANVRDNVGANVRANVWDNVGNNVGANVRDNVGANLEYFYFSDYGSIRDYGWVAFYDFFTRIKVLKNKDFNWFQKLLETNIYDMIQMESMCIVCELPKYIDRDEKGRIHSLVRPAIEWEDTYGIYYINGVNFTAEEWTRFISGKMDAIDIMNEKNQDKKRVMIMNYGNEKLIKELQAKELSREKDAVGNDMVLWQIPRKDDTTMIFYEGIDNSKDEKVYLRLPPEFENKRPLEAKLWTFKPLWEQYQKDGVIPEFVKET